MFTGIVTAVGTVRGAVLAADGLTLRVGSPYRGLRRGESIAVDGACLTVERVGKAWFEVHVVRTSLGRTRFGEYASGRRVNLERALKAADRLGGHLVQGHVDGVGEIVAASADGDAWLLDVRLPDEIARISIPLGSVALDGVSLTVNAVPAPGVIQVSLIPFTLRHTTLGQKRPGDGLHVEGDAIGKYVAALLTGRDPLAQRPAIEH